MNPTPRRSGFSATALLLAATIIVIAAPAAVAHEYTLGKLTIGHPWARASAGTAPNGAAYLVVDNAGADDRLVAVTGDVAQRVELHTHMMEGDVMKMRPVEAVDVPAGGSAVLQPGGLHVMLIGLKQPLKEGTRFPLTLTFEKAGKITVEVAVEGVASMGPQGHQGGMHHGTMAPSN